MRSNLLSGVDDRKEELRSYVDEWLSVGKVVSTEQQTSMSAQKPPLKKADISTSTHKTDP